MPSFSPFAGKTEEAFYPAARQNGRCMIILCITQPLISRASSGKKAFPILAYHHPVKSYVQPCSFAAMDQSAKNY